MKFRPELPLAALAALLLLAAPIPSRAVEKTAVVKVTRANVRSGPGTGYPAIHAVEEGERLTVIEESGDWIRIKLPREGQGWIYKDMVRLEAAAASSAPASSSSTQTAAASSSGGSEGGGILGSLKRGFTSSRQDEVTAAAGSRGLGEESGGGSRAADYEAVKRMEALHPAPEQVRAFIRDGGLVPEKMP